MPNIKTCVQALPPCCNLPVNTSLFWAVWALIHLITFDGRLQLINNENGITSTLIDYFFVLLTYSNWFIYGFKTFLFWYNLYWKVRIVQMVHMVWAYYLIEVFTVNMRGKFAYCHPYQQHNYHNYYLWLTLLSL